MKRLSEFEHPFLKRRNQHLFDLCFKGDFFFFNQFFFIVVDFVIH